MLGLTAFACHSGASIWCRDVVFNLRDGSAETRRRRSGLNEAKVCGAFRNANSRGFDDVGRERAADCHPRATAATDHTNAALPPRPILIAATTSKDVCASTEGEMLGKVFALAVVIGLLVTSSAAFVANHPRTPAACAASCE